MLFYENAMVIKPEEFCLDELEINNNEPNLNDIIEEETTEGHVIMRYNKDNGGFEYWTDKSTINFKILKTVCRKYCLLFDMKNLYIDGYKEYLKDKKKWKKEREALIKKFKKLKESKDEECVTEDDCVFIKAKPILNTKTQKKEVNVEWRENKFIRKGKIMESPLNIEEKVPKTILSFDDFKKLIKEK
tara:strand:- start:106 stop:669 length:564 start_codon:yes stop_codon:yes gene_type:complete